MRWLKLIWWFPLAIYMIVSPSFVADIAYRENCNRIEIDIKDSLDNALVSSDMLFSLIHNDDNLRLGTPMSEIDIESIETQLKEINELSSVEVYSTIDGTLHVEADQRDPIVRIITSYGNSYYIDDTGVIIDHSSDYTPRVLVVSGAISVPDKAINKGNVNSLAKTELLVEILDLVKEINSHDLWSSQFEQLWVSEDGNVELIPRVGNQVIKLGNPEGYRQRLKNLEAFYKDAIHDVGWNSYREINLMYEGQIVCKKR